MRMQIAASTLAIAAALMVSPALAGRAHIDTSHDNQTIYPPHAQAMGEEGLVRMQAYVRPNGRATRVRLVQGTGYYELDRAAIQTVMNWRFVPATENGEAVSDWTDLQIAYKLPESASK